MSFTSLLFSPRNRKKTLLLLLWLTLIVTAFFLRSVLLPFVFAGLLAYILEPATEKICNLKIRNRKIPKGAAVIVVYLMVATLVYFFATLLLPELYREFLRLGTLATDWLHTFNQKKIQELAATIDAFFLKYNLPIHIIAPFEEPTLPSIAGASADKSISINLAQVIQNTLTELKDYIQAQSIDIVDRLQHFLREILNFIFKFFLVLMLAGFMLVDLESIKRFAFAMSPTKNKADFTSFLQKIDEGLAGVIRGQLTICAVNGFLTLIGLWIFKIKFALLLATLAGIFSLIPIFGSIISTIPITMVALLESPFTALLALAWIVGIHALEANFLNPKIMGKTTKIHPVIVVLALVAGEHFYGLVGALLAVPIASIVLNIFTALLNKTNHPDHAL